MPRRSFTRTTLQAFCALLTVLAVSVAAAWLIGRIVGDRWALTQWLLWIPTPAMLPAIALGLLGAVGPGRTARRKRPRLWGWIAFAVAVTVWFCCFEHHLLRRAPDPADGVKIAHWNMTHGRTREEIEPHLRQLAALDGDVVILGHAWGISRNARFLEALDEDAAVFYLRDGGDIDNEVTVITRLPLLEARTILITDESWVYLLRIDCTETLGRSLVIHVIDLPSSPRRGRMEMAREIRRILDAAGAPPPDIVVGDCNMTRSSPSLAALMPGMHHAFDEGGHGYGATFHRAFPLYHIDHILLDDPLRCTRYDLIDPGVGRHYAQTAWIRLSH